MDENILPEWARSALLGKTIESVTEDAHHSLTLSFSDGDSLTVTAMPFKDGVLDASLVIVSDLKK